MCWKFLISITILVVTSLLMAASFNFDRKSFCKTNHQKAIPSEAAKEVMDTKVTLGVGKATSQQMNLVLSHHVQQAAKAATEVLAGKIRQLEVLAKRLHENQNVFEEGQRAMELTTITLKRMLWLRDITRQDLKNMMHLYKSRRGNQVNINYLVTLTQQEEAKKNELLHATLQRFSDLKKSMKLAQAELKSIRESAKKANHAAEEARQRVDLLRQLAPKIKKLKGKDLQIVTDFLIKHRHAHVHSSI